MFAILGTLGTIFTQLGLALMIGGLLALGAFTAPVLFKQFPRDAAGVAMTVIFRRYDTVLLVSAGLVLVGLVLAWLSGQRQWLKLGLGAVLSALVIYSCTVINPQLEAKQNQGLATPADHQQFQALHKQSEALAKSQLFLGLVVLIVTAL
jgi:hypothetical protein